MVARKLDDDGESRIATLTILGLPVTFSCSSREDTEALRAACDAVAGDTQRSQTALNIDLVTSFRGGAIGIPTLQVKDRRLTIRGAGAIGIADADQRTASCTLDSGYFADPPLLFAGIIEPIVLFLAARNGRTPLHAAAIELDEIICLLSGPSGSGKSSLALAADRSGIRVLSEDTVFIRQAPTLAIWGWGNRAHLFPADARGLGGPIRERNGKRKVAVALGGGTPGRAYHDARLCLLERGHRVSLERLSTEEARSRMVAPEPGFDLLASEVNRLQQRLVEHGAWLLTLSADPDEAIELLRRQAPRFRTM